MEFFLDFSNLLNSNWGLISTHPMLFILYGVLVAALTLTGRRFFVKNKLDVGLINEKQILEDELHREREKSNELMSERNRLKRKSRSLAEEIKKLRAENEEQGDRLRELNLERISLLRKIEQLEDAK